MYSNPTSAYPIALTVGKSYEDNLDLFDPDYNCDSPESFNEALKEILSSKETLNLVATLYSKAKSIVVED